jgi:hypothetical protein
MDNLKDNKPSNNSVEDLLMEFLDKTGQLANSKEFKEAGLFGQTDLYRQHVSKYALLIKSSALMGLQ